MKMKTLFAFAAVVVFALAFTSCRKDYKCTCKDSNGIIIEQASQTYKQVKKKDAESSCESFSNTWAKPLGGSCSI